MGADITDKFDIVEITEPVGVVDHLGLAFAELDKAAHLLLKAFAVMVDHLHGHHFTQVLSAGRVADHAGAAADQGDGLVACHLQTLHQKQSHEMPNVKRIRCGIESDIEGSFAVIDELSDFLFTGDLCKQTSCLQFFIDLHLLQLSFKNIYLESPFGFKYLKGFPFQTGCFHGGIPHHQIHNGLSGRLA